MALFITKDLQDKPASPFLHHASFAVGFEQDGRFADAAQSWHLAMKVAVKESDVRWAEDRRAFCRHAIKNDWGQQYACGGVQ